MTTVIYYLCAGWAIALDNDEDEDGEEGVLA